MIRSLLVVLFVFLGSLAFAQDVPSLFANKVTITEKGSLIAEGNAQFWFNGQQLTASRIAYDQATDTLTIQGPLTLRDGSGVVLLADAAELDQDFKNGILISARMILNQNVQVVADTIEKRGERYTVAADIAATSCYVCDNRTPIWQIRADRVLHDRDEKQLYFENATLRIFDLPVFWFPILRLPDPTLERAQGFLVPEIKSSSQLGTSLRVPYFIPFGPSRDLTLAPWIFGDTTTVDFRYRQAHRNGTTQIEGALSYDALLPDEYRGYLFSSSAWSLGNDYNLGLEIEATTDDAYLLSYGFSDNDRLESAITLDRTKRFDQRNAKLAFHHSLRTTEDNATIPTQVFDGRWEKRIIPSTLGGEVDLTAELHASHRYSNDPTDGPDADVIVDGFDVARFSLGAEWQKNFIWGPGLRLDTLVYGNIDHYGINQHVDFPTEVTDARGGVAGKVSFPLKSVSENGAIDILQPAIQVILSDGTKSDVPNQDSTRNEFDRGNLFRVNRATGADLAYVGNRLDIGVSWDRYLPSEGKLGFSLGRSLRETSATGFSETSGLNGLETDWLLAAHYSMANGPEFLSRAIVADDGTILKNETEFKWNLDRTQVDLSYVWLAEDLEEDRPVSIGEMTFEGSYDVNDFFTVSSAARYDFRVDRLSTARIGLSYENECVDIDFNVSRRFTSSTSVDPSTDYGLSVNLTGFGVGPTNKRHVKRCN